MSHYKLTPGINSDEIKVEFEKFDSPLSERTFIITDVKFHDDPDGGGSVDFIYTEDGNDINDPETNEAMGDVFREIVAMLVASMQEAEQTAGTE